MLNPNIDLPSFGLSNKDLSRLDERTFIVRHWNWDYASAHKFQRHCVDLIQEMPRLRILICCNHPHVFTNGRGLQKPRKGETLELKEFRPEDHRYLPFPLHQIERGGGLTFHHPGQFIFYPILKLNPATLSLSKMTDEIFDFSAEILSEWGLQDISHNHKLMGLWHGERKLASMGIAIEKLTTFHGMALNLYLDQKMKSALLALNPCGLSGTTYTSVEELVPLPESALDNFANKFINRIAGAWK